MFRRATLLLAAWLCCFAGLALGQSGDSCVRNPADPECASYEMPLPMVQWGIDTNCMMMDFMPGCTVERICTTSSVSSSSYCDGFSILKDLCLDMPSMRGCNNYTTMCKTNGSVVGQCGTKALPLPNSMALSNIVEGMCNDMFMEPCSKCLPKQGMFLQCDILQVYSDLCKSMWMDGCQSWETLCQTIPDWPLCSSSSGDEVPVMRMYFHFSILDYVLFKEWVPRDWLQYTLSILAIIAMGIAYEFLKVMRSVHAGWAKSRDEARALQFAVQRDDVIDQATEHFQNRDSQLVSSTMKWDWKVELMRASLAFLETALALILMLVAMTFNVGLFLAVCGGAFCGSLLFGRFSNVGYSKYGCH